jgi:hypothetical protein
MSLAPAVFDWCRVKSLAPSRFPAIEARIIPLFGYPETVSQVELLDDHSDPYVCALEPTFLENTCDLNSIFPWETLRSDETNHLLGNLSSSKFDLLEGAKLTANLLQQQQAFATEPKDLNLTLMPAQDDNTELDWIRRLDWIFARLKSDSTDNSGDSVPTWEDPNLLCWAVLLVGLASLFRIAVVEYHCYLHRVREAAIGSSGRKAIRGTAFTLKEYVQYR